MGELVHGCEFKVFASVVEAGGAVLAINAGPRELSRAEQDGLSEFVQRYGAKAVAPIVVGDGGWRGNLAKFFDTDQIAAVNAKLEASEGDLLLFVADRSAIAAQALGALRLELGERFGLIDHDRHDVLWIVEFPMFEYDEEEGRWTAMHHPFTAPAPAEGAQEIDFSQPGALLSNAYDLVVDGAELGGGSIRTHTPEIQQRVFERDRAQRAGGAGAIRLPARRAALRRAAAWRNRARPRPHRRDARRPRVDPRGDRLPQDRQRLRSADRGAGTRRRAHAARPRPAPRIGAMLGLAETISRRRAARP